MDRMSGGSGGMGGSSSGGLGSAIGTASSLASLGSMAYSAGNWLASLPIFALASGGRVGKAGGGAMVNTQDPKYHQMKLAFDNMVKKYDNNPLLAAAALDAGPATVDAAIRKAAQTGRDVTDFLPRRTQEYMYALSQAALGAHNTLARQARATGGRTGYAKGSTVDDAPAGLAPAPSDAMTMGDVAGGLAPQGEQVQIASAEPTAKGPDLSPDALRTYTAKKASELKLDPDFAVKVFGGESGFKPHAIGDDNSSFNVGQFHYGNVSKKYPNPGLGDQFTKDTGLDARDPNNAYEVIDYGLTHAAKKGWNDWTVAKNLMAQGQGKAAPIQVASATGLAPKSDAGPYERTFGKILPDAVPTDSSFWVPLIAGLGSMLASNQYRFSQRLGEGLVGGAAAYGKQQEFEQRNQQLAQQAAQNAALMGLKKQELGFTEREVALKEAEQKRRIDAAKAAAAALSGNVAPVQPSAPVPTAKTTVAPPSVGGAQPSTLNNAAPAIPPVGGVSPPAGGLVPPSVEDKDKTPAAPIPSSNSSFWENVHPQSNPHNLDEMANRFDQAAAAAAEDPSSMAAYRTSAQQYRAQANAIRQSGIVTMKDQSTASIPGFNEAKAAQAAALKKAELDVTTSPEARAAEVEKQRLLEEEKQRYATFEDNEGNQWRRAAPSDTPVQMAATPNTTAAAGEPVKASLDPKTARVNNVIPAPPVGGGIPQAIPPREGLVLAKSAGLSPAAKANDQKFSEEFPGKLHNAIEGEEAMQTVAQAFKLFNSNVLAEKLQGYALLAKATGMPDSVVEAVAGGDPAAMQRVDKEAVPSVIGILKEGASRFGQQEFMVTQKTAVASKTADPKANHALVGELMGKAQWNKQFLTDWDKAKDEGWRSPSAFFASWSQANPLNTYILSATKQIGNFRGMDLPKDPNAYVEGAIYVAPERFGTPALEKYFGSIGVKPGQLFKYNGPNNLQPIAKEDYYTAHLTGRR
jgi:hypothetical protein